MASVFISDSLKDGRVVSAKYDQNLSGRLLDEWGKNSKWYNWFFHIKCMTNIEETKR